MDGGLDGALFVASKLFWFAVRPNTLALLLAVVGLLLLWRGRRSGRWFALLGLGYYVAVLATPAAQWIVRPLEDRFPRSAPTRVDGIVVLGGAVEQKLTEARGIPALNGAAERMTEPLVLARRWPDARIVFSGGQGLLDPGALTEAGVARELWTAMGLPQARVLYEDRARNTHENATLSLALAQPRAGEVWLLVTSAMHMPRSMGVFRAAGWDPVAWPVNYNTGDAPGLWYNDPFPTRLNQFEAGLREWVGLVAYRVLGRTAELFPAP